MGLRGFVDAWGNPVKREGFTRPALTEPAPAANKPANARSVSTPPANKPAASASASEPAKPAADRTAYMRELMRAKRAKAKAQAKPKGKDSSRSRSAPAT